MPWRPSKSILFATGLTFFWTCNRIGTAQNFNLSHSPRRYFLYMDLQLCVLPDDNGILTLYCLRRQRNFNLVSSPTTMGFQPCAVSDGRRLSAMELEFEPCAVPDRRRLLAMKLEFEPCAVPDDNGIFTLHRPRQQWNFYLEPDFHFFSE